jgi:uncharacterized membrane protein YphA (DoxX/SURF4 family)
MSTSTESRQRVVGYWIATGLIAVAMLSGGVGDLVRPPPVLEGMTHLGYPPYFMLILGAWKVLGGGVILAPRLPRVKEWAYAGILFDLTGATASHFAVGDDVRHIVTPLVLAGIAMASWALRPDSRRLAG